MANDQEIGLLPTRALRSYVERYKPALDTKIARSKALINDLNDDSSIILVDRAMEETRKAEALGEEIAYYCRHISGRRDWTEDQIPATDVIVSNEMDMQAVQDQAEVNAKVRDLVDFYQAACTKRSQ